MKKIVLLSIVMLLVYIGTISFGYAMTMDVSHGSKYFSISASEGQSSSKSWTPAFSIPSDKFYIKSYAISPNQGVDESKYYVAPKGGSLVGLFNVNVGTQTKNCNQSVVGGTSYNCFTQKWHQELTVELETIKVTFCSKNNS
ncbi:MAG: hypothetical protein IKI62_06415 [Clostridia bacterium]|nr:hypothetical protein [Clostridia bacterium]